MLSLLILLICLLNYFQVFIKCLPQPNSNFSRLIVSTNFSSLHKDLSVTFTLTLFNYKQNLEPVLFNYSWAGSINGYVISKEQKITFNIKSSSTVMNKSLKFIVWENLPSGSWRKLSENKLFFAVIVKPENNVNFKQGIKNNKVHAERITTITIICFVCILIGVSMCVALRASHRRLQGETEEARFDFRPSSSSKSNGCLQYILEKLTSPFIRCFDECTCRPCRNEDDASDEEETHLFNSFKNAVMTNTAKDHQKKSRKISYYGTVHMTLAQQNTPIISDEGSHVTNNGSQTLHEL